MKVNTTKVDNLDGEIPLNIFQTATKFDEFKIAISYLLIFAFEIFSIKFTIKKK